MSTDTDANYMEYGDLTYTECQNCPFSSGDGYYVWCPNCGSDNVRYN